MLHEKLFSEFPEISTQEWLNLITKDLKGADFDSNLRTPTPDGFTIQPFYRAEDVEKLNYLRENKDLFRKNQKLSNRQRIEIQNIEILPNEIRELHSKGVDAVEILLPEHINFTINDLVPMIRTAEELNLEVHFVTDRYFTELIDLLNNTKLSCSIGFDPLGYIAVNGSEYNSFSGISAFFQDLPKFSENVKVININAKHFGNAGASASQELGCGLAMLSEYLNITAETNTNILPHIQYVSSVGSHFFIEIAKLKATRLLYQNVAETYFPNAKITPYIHTETTTRNKTAYSKHTNILRATTEAMSANLGGADSFCALPFDAFTGEHSDLAKRIARNTQIILNQEAKIDAVINPAEGSYYIENLTDKIAETAWTFFKEIEAQGGYFEALKTGFIQAKIEETAQKAEQSVAENKTTVLGVNKYPDNTETIENLNVKKEVSTKNLLITPLTVKRLAESLEQERFEINI